MTSCPSEKQKHIKHGRETDSKTVSIQNEAEKTLLISNSLTISHGRAPRKLHLFFVVLFVCLIVCVFSQSICSPVGAHCQNEVKEVGNGHAMIMMSCP